MFQGSFNCALTSFTSFLAAENDGKNLKPKVTSGCTIITAQPL